MRGVGCRAQSARKSTLQGWRKAPRQRRTWHCAKVELSGVRRACLRDQQQDPVALASCAGGPGSGCHPRPSAPAGPIDGAARAATRTAQPRTPRGHPGGDAPGSSCVILGDSCGWSCGSSCRSSFPAGSSGGFSCELCTQVATRCQGSDGLALVIRGRVEWRWLRAPVARARSAKRAVGHRRDQGRIDGRARQPRHRLSASLPAAMGRIAPLRPLGLVVLSI